MDGAAGEPDGAALRVSHLRSLPEAGIPRVSGHVRRRSARFWWPREESRNGGRGVYPADRITAVEEGCSRDAGHVTQVESDRRVLPEWFPFPP
jgi:hypothetical protein